MFARLRGIDETQIPRVVVMLVTNLLLQDHIDKQCGDLRCVCLATQAGLALSASDDEKFAEPVVKLCPCVRKIATLFWLRNSLVVLIFFRDKHVSSALSSQRVNSISETSFLFFVQQLFSQTYWRQEKNCWPRLTTPDGANSNSLWHLSHHYAKLVQENFNRGQSFQSLQCRGSKVAIHGRVQFLAVGTSGS